MFARAVQRLTAIMVVGVVLSGCGGLDGIRGTLVQIEGNQYVLRDSGGHELRFVADEHTRKDDVRPGDDVRIYATKDRQVMYIYKLDGEQGGSGSAVHKSHRNRHD